jgi:hypothetical protein
MKMSDIKFPPVGKDCRFLIKVNGAPFAGHDTRAEAERAMALYKTPPSGRASTFASAATWTIEDRG